MKTLEELTRDQLGEKLCLWNQPVGGSKKQLQKRLISVLRKESLDPDTETFEIEDAKSTLNPLSQILEKLSAADNHLTNLTAKADQQQERLAVICAKTDQQQEHQDAMSTKMEQHLAALNIKINQQQADHLTTLGIETQQQITECQKEIPQEVQ